MATLTRRLQVLLDDDRMRRLEQHAQRRGTSVAVLVREAIDATFPAGDAERRLRAGEALLAAPPMPVDDWPTMKRQDRAALYGESDSEPVPGPLDPLDPPGPSDPSGPPGSSW